MIVDAYRPTTLDPFTTANVPVANVRPRNDFPETEFVNRPNVPVFTEHETTCTSGRYQGRRLKFSYSELLAVAQRCNRRIEERGDYAGITAGYHTPPRELIWKGEAVMPPLVGFAGPFRMGQIDTGNGGRIWAILADFHFFRESYWVRLPNGQQISIEKQYPRRSAELWLEERYADMFLDPITLLSADAPRLDMGLLYSTQSHSGDLCEVYSVAAAPSASSVFVPSGGAKKHYSDPGDPVMALAPEDVQQIVAAIMQTEPMQFLQSLMAQSGDPNGQPPGPSPDGGGAPTGADPMQNAGGDPMGGAGPMPGAAPGAGPMGSVPATPPAPIAQPTKPYSGEDDMDDDDEFTATTPAKPKKADKEDYSAAQLYQRIHNLEGQLEVERYARINDARRGWFASKAAEGYPVDIEAEMAICAAGAMSKQQFEHYSKQFEKVRTPAPLNQNLHVPSGPAPSAKGQTVSRPDGTAEVYAYSKDVSDRAMSICQSMIDRGEDADYGEVLQKVAAGQL